MLRIFIISLPFFILLLEPLLGLSAWLGLEQVTFLALTMMGWMILWWVSDIMPLGITGLIPIVFLPLFGVSDLRTATGYYSDPIIFLFLGGFMIARALEKTQLSERIALVILKFTGSSDRGVVLGFVMATALLSMWISNTATAVMMLPIAYSVLLFLEKNATGYKVRDMKNLSIVIYLSIAYAANIGGTMTPIGTPPNVVLVGYLDELYGIRIDFWKWFLIIAPVATSLLFLQFKLLNFAFPYTVNVGRNFGSFVRHKLKELGSVSGEQKITLMVFCLTAFLWVFKDLIHYFAGKTLMSDTNIAIFGGLLLFLIPTSYKKPVPVLDKEDISFMPWNIILLFGGGMALAGTLQKIGLIELMTNTFATMDIQSAILLVTGLAMVTLILTEVMSNVALCVVALPVLMSLGQSQGISPVFVGLPAVIASSFAFSMPISTPPNAIVFGSNKIQMKDMLRVGIILNILGIACMMSIGWGLMHLFLK